MIWSSKVCAEIRARIARDDFNLDAYDAEVVARIERATGRTFGFGAVGNEVMS